MEMRLLVAGFVLAALASWACERSSPTSEEPSSSSESSESDPEEGSSDDRSASGTSVSDEAESRDLERTVREALCEDRDPCVLENHREAGKDEQGRALVVQNVRISERERPPTEKTRKNPYHAQWWLARVSDGEVRSRQLLVDDRKYRNVMYDSDEVTVNEGRFVHSAENRTPMGWLNGTITVLELSPLRLREQRHSKENTNVPTDIRSKRIDWLDFRARTNWFVPTCGTDEEVPEDESEWYAFRDLPRVDLDASFRNGGWKEVTLEACAAEVDSSGTDEPDAIGTGFVVHGEPGSEGDAAFRAVFGSPTELFVEVVDDRWVRSADSKILNDHFEVWLAHEAPDGDGPNCLARETSPRHFGVGLDGSVYSAAGTPVEGALRAQVESIDAKRGSSREVGRFRAKLTFEKEPPHITVVYSDSDDGEEQERLIATSKLEPGELWTLGKAREFDEAFGHCELDQGRLEYKRDQSFEPSEPAVDLGGIWSWSF